MNAGTHVEVYTPDMTDTLDVLHGAVTVELHDDARGFARDADLNVYAWTYCTCDETQP